MTEQERAKYLCPRCAHASHECCLKRPGINEAQKQCRHFEDKAKKDEADREIERLTSAVLDKINRAFERGTGTRLTSAEVELLGIGPLGNKLS